MLYYSIMLWAIGLRFSSSSICSENSVNHNLSPRDPVKGLASKHHGPKHGSFYQRNLDTIQKIYQLNVYPNNVPFHQTGAAGVPTGLFNAAAAGRIAPLGNFTTFNQSVEYFFGLSGTQSFPIYDYFDRIEVHSFLSDCPGVASSLAWLHAYVKPPGQNSTYLTTLKQFVFWRFDDEGAVRYYDAYIPNLNAFAAMTAGLPRPDSDLSLDNQRLAIQYLMCPQIQAACIGPNQQYTNEGECREILESKVYGDWDEIWGDSVVCRQIHLTLAKVDPIDHCPHVGPIGGGKCSPIAYNDVYFTDEELFGGLDTFRCPA